MRAASDVESKFDGFDEPPVILPSTAGPQSRFIMRIGLSRGDRGNIVDCDPLRQLTLQLHDGKRTLDTLHDTSL